MGIKTVPYLLSQYLWFFVATFIATKLYLNEIVVNMPSRKCKSGGKFSESYDPDYFYHLTDIHISYANATSTRTLKQGLKVGQKYRPKVLFITGDLTDNYEFKYMGYYFVRVSKQNDPDWILYDEIMSEYNSSFPYILECVGNHDAARLWTYNSKDFNFLKYAQINRYHDLTKSLADFQIVKTVVGNITYLNLNPFDFPYPPIPFKYYIIPTKDYLDRLEKAINDADNDKTLILGSHFHSPVIANTKSSSGKNFREIINNPKVSMFISGHNHGKKQMIMHHGDALEVVGSDLRYDRKAGIVTVDNGMSIFHHVNIDAPADFFVTYPAPVNQTTSRTTCFTAKPIVRVITFNKIDSMTATIDDKNEMPLKLERPLHNGTYLYSAHFGDIYRGIHNLTVIGNGQRVKFEFIYDENGETPKGKETMYDNMVWYNLHIYLYIVIYILTLFITLPTNRWLFEGYTAWIEDDKDNKDNVKNWLITIFAGFIGIRGRISYLQYPLRVLIFVSTLLSPFIPLFTFHIEGHTQYAFAFGVTYGSKISYESFCTYLIYQFAIASVIPVLFACSSVGLSRKICFNSVQVVDLLVYIKIFYENYNGSVNRLTLLNDLDDGKWSGFILYISSWTLLIGGYIIANTMNCLKGNSYHQIDVDKYDDSNNCEL